MLGCKWLSLYLVNGYKKISRIKKVQVRSNFWPVETTKEVGKHKITRVYLFMMRTGNERQKIYELQTKLKGSSFCRKPSSNYKRKTLTNLFCSTIRETKLDQYQYLGNCPPTPPLTQQQSIDNKLRLMLGQGRGRWAVAQILILIHKVFIFTSLSFWSLVLGMCFKDIPWVR